MTNASQIGLLQVLRSRRLPPITSISGQIGAECITQIPGVIPTWYILHIFMYLRETEKIVVYLAQNLPVNLRGVFI